MEKLGLPNYQVESYSNRKIYKTLFIASAQMVCVMFQNFVALFLKHTKNFNSCASSSSEIVLAVCKSNVFCYDNPILNL